MTKLEAINLDEDVLRLQNQYFLQDKVRSAEVNGWFWGLKPQYSIPGLTELASTKSHDGWAWAYMAAGIKQPKLVEQVAMSYVTKDFYARSAILALAAKECGGVWERKYWKHYILGGGFVNWLWAADMHNYAKNDATVRNLWVLCKLRGTTKMRAFLFGRLLKLSQNMNPFWYAHAVNVGAVCGEQKQCEDALLSFRTGATAMTPFKHPDTVAYFDEPRSPKHKSVIAFALKLLWQVK